MRQSNEAKDGQRRLFKAIKELHPKDWKDRIHQLIGGANATIYKKVNGQTPLSFGELHTLAQAFNLSIDTFLGLNGVGLTFSAPSIGRSISTVQLYLEGLTGELSGAMGQESKVLYATSEIPVFHYFHSRHVAAFKLAVWAKSVWQLYPDTSMDQLIKTLLNDEEFNNLRLRTVIGYCQINSIELWPSTLLNNTLNQLQYYIWSAEMVQDELIKGIIDGLIQLVDHFEQMATLGHKFVMGSKAPVRPDTFTLYHNEIFHTNNTIILDKGQKGMVYLTHDSPNYIKSDHAAFLHHTKNWFSHMVSMSGKLSVENLRGRRRFFSNLMSQVQALESSIEAIRRIR